MAITILDDDEPGTFQFKKRGHVVKESAGAVNLSITRQGGADGEVKLKWRTRDKNAVSGKDYSGGEGEITFNHGETQRSLSIPIMDDMEKEKDEQFEVELYEADNNAKLGKQVKTMVTIVNDDEYSGIINKLTFKTRMNLDRVRLHNETYAQQFRDAMIVNGGVVEGASNMDYLLHMLTFPFKVLMTGFQGFVLTFFFVFQVGLRHHPSPRYGRRLPLLPRLSCHDWTDRHCGGRSGRDIRMSRGTEGRGRTEDRESNEYNIDWNL